MLIERDNNQQNYFFRFLHKKKRIQQCHTNEWLNLAIIIPNYSPYVSKYNAIYTYNGGLVNIGVIQLQNQDNKKISTAERKKKIHFHC